MANIVSFSVTDFWGKTVSVPIYVTEDLTDAQYQAFVDSMGLLIDACVDGKMTGVSLTRRLSVPSGVKGAAIEGATARQGGNFAFDAADTPYRHTVHLPTIKDSFVDGEDIDITGDTQSFVNAVAAGVDPCFPTDKYDNDLNTLINALVSFRKR